MSSHSQGEIPIAQLQANQPPQSDAEMNRLIVQLPSLPSPMKAQYQIMASEDLDDVSHDDYDEPEQQPMKSPDIQIPGLEDEQRAESSKPAPRKRILLADPDPEFIWDGQPSKRRITTRSATRDMDSRKDIREEFESRFRDMPAEMKQAIVCAFATKKEGAYEYIDAFYFHKAWRPFRRAMYEALGTVELLLDGPDHADQYKAMHPIAVKQARYLKVIYNYDVRPYPQRIIRSHLARIARQTERVRRGANIRIHAPLPALFTSFGPVSTLPLRFLLGGGGTANPFYSNLQSMLSLTELFLDMRPFISYLHRPENALMLPTRCCSIVLTTIQSACGFEIRDEYLPADVLLPRVEHNGASIKKVTLLLPPVEVARETAVPGYARDWAQQIRTLLQQGRQHDATAVFATVPEHELLREVLQTGVRYFGFGPAVRVEVPMPRLTEYEFDVEKGMVVFSAAGYTG